MSVFFFSHRIVKIWNELSIHTDFTSINSFEQALAGFNFTAYCDIKLKDSFLLLCFLCNFMALR